MTDSILTSIKESLGISATDTTFDPVIINHINSVLMILNQLGVGPTSVFTITDSTAVWTDFLAGGEIDTYALVKSYMALRVGLLFDPPTSGFLVSAIERSITEMEVRLGYQVIDQTTV